MSRFRASKSWLARKLKLKTTSGSSNNLIGSRSISSGGIGFAHAVTSKLFGEADDNSNSSSDNSDTLLHQSLDYLARVGGVGILKLPSSVAAADIAIPSCFAATAQYLAKEGANVPGIFRIPGQNRTVKLIYEYFLNQLRSAIRSPTHSVELTIREAVLPKDIQYNVHDVASVFKRMLGELPGGLLGSIEVFEKLNFAIFGITSQQSLSRPPTCSITQFDAKRVARAILEIDSTHHMSLISAVFGLLAHLRQDWSDLGLDLNSQHPQESLWTDRKNSASVFTSSGQVIGSMSSNAMGLIFAPLLLGDLMSNVTSSTTTTSAGSTLSQEDVKTKASEVSVRFSVDGSNACKPVLSTEGLGSSRCYNRPIIKSPSRTRNDLNLTDSIAKTMICSKLVESLVANWEDIIVNIKIIVTPGICYLPWPSRLQHSRSRSLVLERQSRRSLSKRQNIKTRQSSDGSFKFFGDVRESSAEGTGPKRRISLAFVNGSKRLALMRSKPSLREVFNPVYEPPISRYNHINKGDKPVFHEAEVRERSVSGSTYSRDWNLTDNVENMENTGPWPEDDLKCDSLSGSTETSSESNISAINLIVQRESLFTPVPEVNTQCHQPEKSVIQEVGNNNMVMKDEVESVDCGESTGQSLSFMTNDKMNIEEKLDATETELGELQNREDSGNGSRCDLTSIYAEDDKDGIGLATTDNDESNSAVVIQNFDMVYGNEGRRAEEIQVCKLTDSKEFTTQCVKKHKNELDKIEASFLCENCGHLNRIVAQDLTTQSVANFSRPIFVNRDNQMDLSMHELTIRRPCISKRTPFQGDRGGVARSAKAYKFFNLPDVPKVPGYENEWIKETRHYKLSGGEETNGSRVVSMPKFQTGLRVITMREDELNEKVEPLEKLREFSLNQHGRNSLGKKENLNIPQRSKTVKVGSLKEARVKRSFTNLENSGRSALPIRSSLGGVGIGWGINPGDKGNKGNKCDGVDINIKETGYREFKSLNCSRSSTPTPASRKSRIRRNIPGEIDGKRALGLGMIGWDEARSLEADDSQANFFSAESPPESEVGNKIDASEQGHDQTSCNYKFYDDMRQIIRVKNDYHSRLDRRSFSQGTMINSRLLKNWPLNYQDVQFDRDLTNLVSTDTTTMGSGVEVLQPKHFVARDIPGVVALHEELSRLRCELGESRVREQRLDRRLQVFEMDHQGIEGDELLR